MKPVASLARMNAFADHATAALVSIFLLATRWYVAWQFLRSGLLKLQDWDTTLVLFQQEYHVPVLSPFAGAVVGTTGELLFPTLLVLGVATRYAAVGLSAVNVMAVVSYANVLLADGSEAALGQHILWGYLLLTVLMFGPGSFSLDRLAERAAARPAAATR
jgi:putative oxidoreductase